MSELKLLPCPFCGGGPLRITSINARMKASLRLCHVQSVQRAGAMVAGLGPAIFAWNRRPTPDPGGCGEGDLCEMDQQQSGPVGRSNGAICEIRDNAANDRNSAQIRPRSHGGNGGSANGATP